MVSLAFTVDVETPLGIRFWDGAFDEPVTSGLEVTAHLATGRGLRRRARPTASGIYAFHSMPRKAALPNPESLPEAMLVEVEVRDPMQRFVACAFEVNLPLPYRGPYPQSPSSFGPTPRGLLLSSSVARRTPSWLLVLRGDLHDIDTGKPAAHAYVKLSASGQTPYTAIADGHGRFQVVGGYPETVAVSSNSLSAGSVTGALGESTEMKLQVYYQPGALRSLDNSGLPSLPSVLSQGQAQIVAEHSAGGTALEYPVSVSFGRPAVVRTRDESQLFVRSA